MIIDMTAILRGMGMIATSPSPWHRFWQMLRITKGWWIRPFKNSARSRTMNRGEK